MTKMFFFFYVMKFAHQFVSKKKKTKINCIREDGTFSIEDMKAMAQVVPSLLMLLSELHKLCSSDSPDLL